MANYKLITFTPTASATSQKAFTAGATNTVVSSVVASDSSTSTLEVLVKKNAGSIIELAHAQVQTDKPEELLTAPVALEALDELYVRTSRVGANFVISYVEETATPNDTALGGLIDVDTTGVSDGDSLVYNATNSQWEPAVVSGGGGGSSTLSGLTDTSITSPVSGNLLRWNGSAWSNADANTSIIVEGTNLYYTDARVDARIAADTTKADAVHTHDADEVDDSTSTHKFVAQADLDKLGHITVTQAVDLDAIESVSTTAFAASNANTSNLANLTASIQNHTDVVLSQAVPANLPDDVFLQWDASTQKWNDKVLTIGDNDNVDVTTTAPTVGDVLEWDGTNWVPAAPSGGGGSTTLDGLTDTNIIAPISGGDVLSYNTGASKWMRDSALNDLKTVLKSTGGTGMFYDTLNDTSKGYVQTNTDGVTIKKNNTGIDFSENSPGIIDFLVQDDGATPAEITAMRITNDTGVADAPQIVVGGTIPKGTNTLTVVGNADFDTDVRVAGDLQLVGAFNGDVSFQNHTDVSISSPASGNYLKYNGTSWANVTPELADMSDVGVGLPADGEFLRHDGTEWVNDNISQSDVTNLTSDLATINSDIDKVSNITSATGAVGIVGDGATYFSNFDSGASLTAGKIYYLHATTGWEEADASAAATATNLLAMCTSTSTNGTSMLQMGVINPFGSQSGIPVGSPVYLSETSGEVTGAAPTTSGAIARVIGYKVNGTDDTIFFNPSNDWIEIS